MKLSEYKNDYYEYSGLASSTSRQLTFAGIALLWIFKSGSDGNYSLSVELYIPAVALIVSLGSDILQYVTATIIWGIFHRYHECNRNNNNPDTELEASKYLTWPINFFFYLKLISVIYAYYYLLKFAINKISFV